MIEQMSSVDINIQADVIDDYCRAIYLEVPGSKVVYLQGYFEIYEGLGTVRTLDIKNSLLCILTTPSMEKDCIAALYAIRDSIPWRPAQKPQGADFEKFLGYFKKADND